MCSGNKFLGLSCNKIFVKISEFWQWCHGKRDELVLNNRKVEAIQVFFSNLNVLDSRYAKTQEVEFVVLLKFHHFLLLARPDFLHDAQ